MASLEELERAAAEAPWSLEALEQLAEARREQGWTHRGKTTDQWIRALLYELSDEEERAWDHALDPFTGLVKIGAGAIPELIARFDEEDPEKLSELMRVMKGLGPEGLAAGSAFLEQLRRPLNLNSREVLDGLAGLGPGAAPWLCEALEIPVIQAQASKALSGLGAEALPFLTEALASSTDEGRRFAAMALADLGAEAAPALDEITAALADSYWEVAVQCVRALVGLGAAAVPSVPALLEAGRVHGLRHEVGQALEAIDPSYRATTAALVGRLEGAEDEGAEEAAEDAMTFLEKIGPSRDTVDLMVRLLDTSWDRLRVRAAQLLARIGAEAAPATEALARALEPGASEELRSYAAVALGVIGEKAAEARPSLTRVLEHPKEEAYIRCDAARALGKIGLDEDSRKALSVGAGDANAELARVCKEALEA